MVRFYIQKRDLNDATSYYVNIIKQAWEKNNEKVEMTDCLKDIAPDDQVLVITIQSFFNVYRHNRQQRIDIWMQGICPEESLMLHHDSISKYPRYITYRGLEWLALKKAHFLFFVSKEMLCHYQRKYGYRKDNYYIMPCFNFDLNEQAFYYEGKYTTPSFVYAGSLSRWQCVEETLKLFVALKKRLPQSRFILLTGEIEQAKKMCQSYGLSNVEIKYIPMKQLGEELAKYKYGLLLRENHVINQVATPNKFNTYLSAGLIPIYSDVMKDFQQILPEDDYCVRVKNIHDPEVIADQIIEMEKKEFDKTILFARYKSIFDHYYSTNYYVNSIASLTKQKKVKDDRKD